jgi:hypothetical protein
MFAYSQDPTVDERYPGYVTQELINVGHTADRAYSSSHTMLTTTIIFALLVAVWGFSGAIVKHAKRGLQQAKPSPRPAPARSTARPARSSGRVASPSH